MADVVISEFIDLAALDDLSSSFDVLFDPGLADRPEDLWNAVGRCRALIVRNRTQVDVALLTRCPRLQVVGRLGAGLDNIDVPACDARGIRVVRAVGANAIAVAEYVIAGALMLLRGAYHATDDLLDGGWPRADLHRA